MGTEEHITVKKLTVADEGHIEDLRVKEQILPETDNTVDLGSSTKQFRDVYINRYAYIDQLGENLDANQKEIKNLKSILFKQTLSPTPGVNGTYGTAIDLTPATGYYALVPIHGYMQWTGTFAAGETVTIKVTATYSDGTTASRTRDRTDTEGAGFEDISNSDWFALYKDGVAITKLSAASMTDQASTLVGTNVFIAGRNT